MLQNQPLNTETEEHNFDVMEQLEKYLRHWKWFVLSAFICLAIAFVYLRYAIPQYKAVASILVKDDKKGGMASELAAFSDLGMLKGVKNNVDNEVEILKSRTLVESTVKKMGLTVSYWSQGNVKSAEIYKNVPIEIVFSAVAEGFYKKAHAYRVESISNTQFSFYDADNEKIGDYGYGQVITLKEGKCIIFKKPPYFKNKPFEITIQINKLDQIVQGFKGRLSVTPLSKTTSVAELSVVDPVAEKAEDFLNTLIAVYNQDAINDKNFILENTNKFINQRLEYITDELDGVEMKAEVFKKDNRVTDIVTESKLFIANASAFEKSEIEIETQLRVVQLMTDFVNKSNSTELIPANVLSSETQAGGLIMQYNELILQRNRLLKNAGANNAVVLALEAKIEALRANVKSSLVQQKRALEITRNDLARQNALIGGKISNIPTLERESRELGRQQQIKETLYLYLLQKREETAISLAVTEPNAKVIDSAMALNNPVSPKRNIIFLAALLIGLLIPFAIIYLMDLLDTKVKSHFDFEGKVSIPFLGDIPASDSPTEIINSTSRSVSAEAMRIVRTNLDFMLSGVPENVAKTIFLTSTVPKEGKTFIAVNLAGTIALSGKKVLLVGLDIRNPKLNQYLDLPNAGITNYLYTKGSDINDYIVKHKDFEQLYVLPSGVIPPNPAELLMDKRIDALFAQFKKEYDYIIVDTAPVTIVTDTLIIAKHADTFVYVVRANYSDKRLLRLAEALYRENKIGKMALLLNDTAPNGGYGYGYGYGYGVELETKPWYRKYFKN
jgi:capsular exopolysaccharide synthesis family protein